MPDEPSPEHRILVVDDIEEIRDLVAAVLKDQGYDTVTADSAESALAAVEERSPALVITDVMMPGTRDGVWLLRELRKLHPGVAVIMMTGFGKVDTAIKCMKYGATDYLTKPVSLHDLTSSVTQALDRRRLEQENRAYQRGLEDAVEERTRELEKAHGEIGELRKKQRTAEDLEASALTVFISYADEDRAYVEELEAQLSVLRRIGWIRTWTDRDIPPGADWRAVLKARLSSSKIVLFVVSPSFFSSDYCCDIEVPEALALRRTGQAEIIPVILSPCDWESAVLADLQALPVGRRPVLSWPDRQEAWRSVVAAIRTMISRMRSMSTGSVPAPHDAIDRAGPKPKYPDPVTRMLGEELRDALSRRQKLRDAGFDTKHIEDEILALRRQLREGGQLRAGDSLGDGRYLLLDEVGRGGFASVWRSLDQVTGTVVALKVLHAILAADELRRERFFRGARIMLELRHPAIVSVLEPRGEDSGWYFFVMEFVEGMDLRRAVQEKHIAGESVINAIVRVAEALGLAHDRGYVHRDIKPANILLDKAGAPFLTDFDLVGAADTTGGTRTGALGTFVYAAPESLDRPQDADARADVFGLGMTAVFALHGCDLPISALRNTEALIDGFMCSEATKAVLKRAVNWSREARFDDAAVFGDALRRAWFRESP